MSTLNKVNVSNKLIGLLVALIIVLTLAISAQALDAANENDWWVLGSGGGIAGNSSLTIESTLGQPIAGSTGSSTSQLNSGYWPAMTQSMNYLPLVHK
jgi:hypothetical protein